MALKSRDLARTETFYCQVLGLDVAFPHPGMLFLETAGGGDLLNFVETRRPFDPRAGGLDHIGLRVPPARWKETLARLTAARVRVRARRERSAVYIQDPNGYTVELYRD